VRIIHRNNTILDNVLEADMSKALGGARDRKNTYGISRKTSTISKDEYKNFCIANDSMHAVMLYFIAENTQLAAKENMTPEPAADRSVPENSMGRPRAPDALIRENRLKENIYKLTQHALDAEDDNVEEDGDDMRQRQTSAGPCPVCGLIRAAKGVDGRRHICVSANCSNVSPFHIGCKETIDGEMVCNNCYTSSMLK